MPAIAARRVVASALTALPLCLVAVPPAHAVQFTTMVTINDNNTCPGTWQTTGTPAAPIFTCVVATTPAPTAPACTITPSQTIAANSSATLALNCSSPTTVPITFSWTQGSAGGAQVANTATYSTPALTTSTTYFATATANNLSTTYQTTVTVQAASTTTPPPATLTSCSGYSVVNVGDLRFDGTQIITNGMKGAAVMVGRLVIPDPLPAGYQGKQASLSAFSWINGTAWKKVKLSKTACDFSGSAPSLSQGLTANLYLSFGSTLQNAVTVQPGEVWYLNVKHELPFGGQSCSNGLSCDFGLRVYPPGG